MAVWIISSRSRDRDSDPRLVLFSTSATPDLYHLKLLSVSQSLLGAANKHTTRIPSDTNVSY